jgi:hypothetical protein
MGVYEILKPGREAGWLVEQADSSSLEICITKTALIMSAERKFGMVSRRRFHSSR